MTKEDIQAFERFQEGGLRNVGEPPAPPVSADGLAHAAIEAAQAVIGQCDCIMHEMPDQDPKRAWYKARDAYLAKNH